MLAGVEGSVVFFFVFLNVSNTALLTRFVCPCDNVLYQSLTMFMTGKTFMEMNTGAYKGRMGISESTQKNGFDDCKSFAEIMFYIPIYISGGRRCLFFLYIYKEWALSKFLFDFFCRNFLNRLIIDFSFEKCEFSFAFNFELLDIKMSCTIDGLDTNLRMTVLTNNI